MESICNEGVITMEEKLQIGIVNEEFILFYQPQYELATRKVVGMEALVRWIHPKEGMIMPSDFIPVAEETGQICALERLIFKMALEQKKQWEETGFESIKLAINLSCKTLASQEDFKTIELIISDYEVDYSNITIEITETCIICNIDKVIRRLQRLKKKGIKIALDDFGTGYSSFTHLENFPIDVIKLDRSYVNKVPNNYVDNAIVKNMLRLASDLQYQVIAEGIETNEQLEYLQKHACQTGQGFLFSRPLPKEKVYGLMA